MAKEMNLQMERKTCAPQGNRGGLESRQQMDIAGSRCHTTARYGCKLWHDDAGNTTPKETPREMYPGYIG
ncbi:MAG: hypothetical protein IKQ20_01050 [Bacteroidales bacterium]|nr:hypothetical protein [Bacteroidales bacterium]